MTSLENQTAIICGGTGRVGSVIVKHLAAAGANILVQYRNNRDAAENLVHGILHSGGSAAAFQADVTDDTSVRELVEFTARKFGQIQIMVNTVHGQFKPKHIADMEWEDWEVHLDALKAHFLLCKRVVPIMREQMYGRIVFISGGLSKRLFAGCSAYTAVKAGLNGFSKTLALEEGRNGITVNIVAPGKVDTMDKRPSTDNPEAWEAMNRQSISNSPLGRDATALDVANAVMYFVSGEASGITGQTLFVAGGEIMP